MRAPTGAVVVSLHRYPVKSLAGEQLDRLEMDLRGCVGDRSWAVTTPEGTLGSGKPGRRFTALPGLQLVRARLRDGATVLEFPDGGEHAVDDPAAARLLSAHVGRRVALTAETDATHFDDGPVSLLGTASVDAVSDELGADVPASRFRANVVLGTTEAWCEDAWEGRLLQLGSVLLRVVSTSPRCVMVDAATAELPALPGVLRAVGRVHDAELGIIAEVLEPGVVEVGHEVQLADRSGRAGPRGHSTSTSPPTTRAFRTRSRSTLP